MWNCVFIMIACVLVTDVFGFWDNFSPILSRWLTKGKISKPIPSKLLTCSVCQSWWLNLLYIILTGHLSVLNVMLILLLSFSTGVVYDILVTIEGFARKVIAEINEYFKI